MKIFLTSAGFVDREIAQAFLAQLDKPTAASKVLVVAYTQNPQEEFYVNESKKELEQFGFENIVVVNMHHPVDLEILGPFDIIYVCGGNTFAILNKFRETGLDKVIIEQVKAGAVYVGVSAGSIIAGPDIEIAGWGSEGDKNDVALKDLSGFNFVNFAVFPHFHEELRDELENFKKRVAYQVVDLANSQAIFAKDDHVKMIGF